jgi:hypothetical protein
MAYSYSLYEYLYTFYAFYITYAYIHGQIVHTYKYGQPSAGKITQQVLSHPKSEITTQHYLAGISNSIVSSVLSHWVLPYFAVASAPFETCLLERL